MSERLRVETVPGASARLHTERRGQGPPLVLISGGGGDAGVYDEVAEVLAERYSVVTYDRRGNSRSPFDDPSAGVGVSEQAGDVIAILDHHGIDKAQVFGSSGGAIIALELLAHHPDRLLAAVVHEPPLVQILPDDSPERAALADIADLGRNRGGLRAAAAFGAMTMPRPPWLFRSRRGQALVAAAAWASLAAGRTVRRVTGRHPGTMARILANSDLLVGCELPEFCFRHRPDLEALRRCGVPWRPATGRDSPGRPYHRPAHVLAGLLGVPCAEFPGGHTDYQEHPGRFARSMTTILEELRS